MGERLPEHVLTPRSESTPAHPPNISDSQKDARGQQASWESCLGWESTSSEVMVACCPQGPRLAGAAVSSGPACPALPVQPLPSSCSQLLPLLQACQGGPWLRPCPKPHSYLIPTHPFAFSLSSRKDRQPLGKQSQMFFFIWSFYYANMHGDSSGGGHLSLPEWPPKAWPSPITINPHQTWVRRRDRGAGFSPRSCFLGSGPQTPLFPQDGSGDNRVLILWLDIYSPGPHKWTHLWKEKPG